MRAESILTVESARELGCGASAEPPIEAVRGAGNRSGTTVCLSVQPYAESLVFTSVHLLEKFAARLVKALRVGSRDAIVTAGAPFLALETLRLDGCVGQ